jgi:Holliday junction DNA helicase RuvA
VAVSAGGEAGSVGADAMSALVNLGYGRAEAHAAMQRARAAGAGDDVSALIAATLQELGQ